MGLVDQKVKDSIELCDEIVELAEEVEQIEAAGEFASSITEKVQGMKDWIMDNNKVTDKMVLSLENMRSGCNRWLRRS